MLRDATNLRIRDQDVGQVLEGGEKRGEGEKGGGVQIASRLRM